MIKKYGGFVAKGTSGKLLLAIEIKETDALFAEKTKGCLGRKKFSYLASGTDQKLVIKDVVLYTGRKIEKTKDVTKR